MLALAKAELPLSDKLELHLARCLDCRACEKVCPSYVSYGLALNSARALIEAAREPSASPAAQSVSILQWLVEKPGRVRTLGKFLWLYHRSGLQWLLRTSRLLRLFGFAELEANPNNLRKKQSHYFYRLPDTDHGSTNPDFDDPIVKSSRI